jgi:glycosyltransferase involved in cell wall biosynthesis
MRLIYFTGLNYPSNIANNQQVTAMAREFHALLGENFTLVVNRSTTAGEFGTLVPVTIGCTWNHLRIFYSAWWFLRHFKSLKKNNGEVVVYSKDPYFCLISIFFKPFFGYKVAFESHLLFSPIVDRLIVRYTDALPALTSHLKKDLISFGASPRKIAIFPDAVAVEQFNLSLSPAEARQKTGLPLDKKIIMYTGSLYVHDWKGVRVLCRSAAFLPPEYIIVLVGIRDEAEIVATVRTGSDKDRIFIVGRQSHEKIPLYLQAADVLVLPNTRGNANSEKYTSPLKLFEYMAARRPIVASNLPSIRDILSEKNSFLAEPGDAKDLARAIQLALSDPAKTNEVVREAWNDVKNRTWRKRAESILAFLRSQLECA